MRIAYLLEPNLCVPSGILYKLKGQSDYWKKTGHEIRFFSLHSEEKHTPSYTKTLTPLIDEAEIFNSPYLKPFKGSLKNYLNKIFSLPQLKKTLNKYNPDLIYYRQGIWFPGLVSIFKKYPTVMEVNTIDKDELKHGGKLKRNLYNYGREKIINSLSGIVSVTHEIASLYESFDVEIKVIANSYDYGIVPSITKKENSSPQIIFVGSPGMVWHGVDKIIKMAKLLPEFTFHLVGEDASIWDAPKNVINHGYLKQDQLFDLYQKINIGLGSLALHRKNMYEACPLKVREYCAFGLPIIIGYRDTDLEGSDFVLNIGNYEKNVEDNADQIRNFIGDWHNKIIPHLITEPIVGYKTKEELRLTFFESLLFNNDK